MKFYVCYEVMGRKLAAGPWDEEHARNELADLATFHGVTTGFLYPTTLPLPEGYAILL